MDDSPSTIQLAQAQADQVDKFKAKVLELQTTAAHLGHLPNSWGHVGELSSINAQLQEVIDRLNGAD